MLLSGKLRPLYFDLEAGYCRFQVYLKEQERKRQPFICSIHTDLLELFCALYIHLDAVHVSVYFLFQVVG